VIDKTGMCGTGFNKQLIDQLTKQELALFITKINEVFDAVGNGFTQPAREVDEDGNITWWGRYSDRNFSLLDGMIMGFLIALGFDADGNRKLTK
jgi:hypothetical protein